MLGTVLKRSALDLWDNGPVLFAGNVAFISAGLALYLAAIEIARLGLGWAIAGLAAAAVAVGWMLCLSACLLDAFLAQRVIWPGLVRDIARRSLAPGAVWATTSLCFGSALWLLFDQVVAHAGGGAAAILLAWVGFTWLQASLFYFPLVAQKRGDVKAALQACLLLVFGNPGFSLAMTAIAIVFFALGAFILPGPAGALILLRNAARMRLLRYAAGTLPGDVPDWNQLLSAERDGLARRTPRSVIFPWKP